MDKIIVITGGTSGIGLELKNMFVNAGDKVYTVSSRELDDPNHYSCDITNELKVKQVINAIGQENGRIDMLINCAGVGMSGIAELVPMDDIEKLVNVNYYGTLYTIRSAIRFMQEGSRIVNVASAMALFPIPFRAIYGSMKSAVLSLSYALRMELKSMGIDVVAFCPGDIKTNFTKNRIKHTDTNERYGDRLKTATEKSDSREDKRIPAEKCAEKIFKKLQKKKTKPMYIIGGKYKFLHFLTRITPKSWLLGMTNALYGGKFEEKINTKKVTKTPQVQEPEVVAEEKKEDNLFSLDVSAPKVDLAQEESVGNSDAPETESVEEVATEDTENIETTEESTDDVENNSLETTDESEQEEEKVEEEKPQEKSNLFGMIEKLKNKDNE